MYIERKIVPISIDLLPLYGGIYAGEMFVEAFRKIDVTQDKLNYYAYRNYTFTADDTVFIKFDQGSPGEDGGLQISIYDRCFAGVANG